MQKHPTTKQRERQRAAQAVTYQQGFNHGYEMGLERGLAAATRIRTVIGQQYTLTDDELKRIVQMLGGLV